MTLTTAAVAGFSFTAAGTLVGLLIALGAGAPDNLVLASILGGSLFSLSGWHVMARHDGLERVD